MAWKPKEKPLTPEEAVELARKDVAPYWLTGEPLLAGVRGPDGRASVHALDKSFDQRAWLVLFGDLTDFSGETVLAYVREWHRRYSPHNLGLLLVVRPTYSFLSSLQGLYPILKKNLEVFPVVLDHEGLISEAFGVVAGGLPAAKLLHQRKLLVSRAGKDWLEGTEREIQGFLRLSDPGLPLAPSYTHPGAKSAAIANAELGSRNRSPLFKIDGNVSNEIERVVIRDPAATIRFRSPSARVSIVAQSALSAQETTRMRVELAGDTVFDAAVASDLTFGDEGAEVRLGEARLYHVLQALPERAREIVLRFPDADRLPAAIYVVRFGA